MSKKELLKTLIAEMSHLKQIDLLNAIVEMANDDAIIDYKDISEAVRS